MKRSRRFLPLSFVIGALATFVAIPAQAQPSERVVFATRNIYLGADVGIAMRKLPNFPAAAQFMWDQVSATDFSQRAPLLARELIATGAQVIGIQEATTWRCRTGLFSDEVVVHDFLKELMSALQAAGGNFSIAAEGSQRALNPGFEISPIPHLTMVRDERLFPKFFGKDRAACGFTISDALLVRDDVTVLDAGTSEYSAKYSIIPTLMTIYRGYSWADLRVGASTFRAITTHLESLWDSNEIPNAAIQADQLLSDLRGAKMPVVVIGDFNSDPRDPRSSDDLAVNPGAQPSASANCSAQVANPTRANAIDTCSAYWKFINAGFREVSPDSLDPKNYSWGADALLAGPMPERIGPSVAMGANGTFTDRLDYIMVKNGTSAVNGAIFGNQWPQGLDTWRCSDGEQVALTKANAQALGARLPADANEGRCLPSDHAGIAGAADLPNGSVRDPRLPERALSPLTFWRVTGGAFLAAISLLIWWRVRVRARRRRSGVSKAVE
jgi:hypothetical protein